MRAISHIADVIARKGPSRKPEVWERPLFSLHRRLRYSRLLLAQRSRLVAPRRFRIAEHALQFELSLLDYIGKSLYLYGVWELHETRFMPRFLRPGMRFVDVGANVGYHALLASRLVGDLGAVFAFEPSERTRSLLVRNLAMNRQRNVIVRAAAVVDVEGSIDFYESRSERHHVLISTIPSTDVSQEARQVQATTLDAFMSRQGVRSLDLVKADVEGAELRVFRGAPALLGSDRPPMLMFESDRSRIFPTGTHLARYGYAIASLRYARRSGPLLVPFEGTSEPVPKEGYLAFQDRHRPYLSGMLPR